ncbi:hypothetical protein V8B97DRAFT_1659814 [Scleroderma yunnanense]
MPDFFKTSSRMQNSPQDTNVRKEAVMNSIRSELALLNVQDLINKASDKCFAKCILKPGTSLSSSEEVSVSLSCVEYHFLVRFETCLSRCLDRYMEAFTLVSRTYTGRLSRESSQMREAAAQI